VLIDELRRTISNGRVLAALAAVPRDVFIPPEWRSRAWENEALPIAAGQTISQPVVVARMCEALAIEADDRVLDVGAGSGYHAAVLAHLGAHVWAVERHPELAAEARRNLAEAGVRNVTVVEGDGSRGHPPDAPYDAINVAAAAAGRIPAALEQQLAPGGRLVAPVSDDAGQWLEVVQRVDGHERRRLEPVSFVPLIEG
jgi:protein-L-isoaspartate(D-aspartate) O-methyltransferase